MRAVTIRSQILAGNGDISFRFGRAGNIDRPGRGSAILDFEITLARDDFIALFRFQYMNTRLDAGCAEHTGAIGKLTHGQHRAATEVKSQPIVVTDVEVQRQRGPVDHGDLRHRKCVVRGGQDEG